MKKAVLILLYCAIFSCGAATSQEKKNPLLLRADSLSSVAIQRYQQGDYAKARDLEMEALQIREKVLGKEHPDYATSLNNLALFNSKLGNYAEAVQLATEALLIEEKILGREHPEYARTLNNLGNYNAYLGNYAEAVRLGTEALQIQEKVLGKEHPEYALSLNNLAVYNSMLGDYAEAVRLGTEALEIREKVFGKEHPDYATSLSSLAGYNSDLGNYTEAVRLETEALQIREKALGKEHPAYATSLSNLTSYLSDLGNYTEAVRLETEALQIREKVLGKNNSSYATSLNNLAYYHSKLGNYTEAVRLATEALQIKEKVLGKNNSSYAISLSSLASYNSALGNYTEAVRLETEALQIQEKIFGKEHHDYAASLNNLAIYNADLGNYTEAVRLGTEALQIREKVFGKEHPDYATSLSSLAGYNSDLGNYTEAVRLETEALQIRGKVFGREHPDYALSLNNLSDYFFWSSDPQNLSRYADEATKCKTNYILKTFANLTASERSLFWQKEEDWFSKIHLYAYTYPTGSLVSNACNSILLSKGLLLNSEIEMNKLLLESGDEEAVEAYKELQMNRRMLDRLYEKPIAERHMNTDSLEQLVDRMEHDLVQRSKIYGDYTRNLAIGWQDVRQKLERRDVAVEFVAFPCGSDSIEYAAYVLKADLTAPRMVPLFEAKQLAAIPKASYYTTPRISELVWQKLDAYIEGAENIYFAPAGELYNIAVETVPDYRTDGWISDRQKFHRLSSTRELAVIKEKSGQKEAVLYGGLKYDTGTQVMEEDSKKYPHEREFTLYNIADSLSLRGGAGYLAGTLSEVTDIDRTLVSSSVHSTLLTEEAGTEASFKDLSGKKRNMLHIATHGFYWTKSEMPKEVHLGFLMSDNDRPRYVEDKALTRSGLLFSGANNALTGIALPEGVDDGILTAKEISSLDLRGLDLVVLSACQTGLGEITGDGVFGLQRGFKKAGANALIMSLWKVDDDATQMLMSRFYKNLIAGKSKYESLREAQRYVREYEKIETIETTEPNSGHRPVTAREREEARKKEQKQTTYKTVRPYRDPKYWAAFILLDGIK